MLSPHILSLPGLEGRHTITTDACNKAGRVRFIARGALGTSEAGEVLLEINERTERAYHIAHRDFLTVACAVLLLRPNFEESLIIFGTDHDTFQWMLNMTDATKELARWRLRLPEP